MKIDQVTLHHLRMNLRSPFETSFGRVLSRDCILLEIAAGGLLGYGECVADREPGYSYETASTAWHVLRDFLVPAILDKDIEVASQLQDLLRHVLNGNPGTAFFTAAAPVVTANSNKDPASTAVIGAAISVVSALTTSDYRLAYDASTSSYTLTRLSDNTTFNPITSGQTVDGVTITLSGTPAAGDSFLIRPTVNGASVQRGNHRPQPDRCGRGTRSGG